MDKEGYKFHVKLGNFELDVEGDKNFVEKTMNRYEGRFLPRFHQLLDAANENPPKEQQAVERLEETGRTAPESQHVNKSSGSKKEKKTKRSRNKKRRNNGSTFVKPAPEVPKNQHVARDSSNRDGKKSHSAHEPELDDIKVSPLTSASPAKSYNERMEDSGKEPALDIDPSDLREIYERINPRTHHEKTLVFAYYLQNRNNHRDFSSNEIRKCYREIGTDPAGNISQVLNHASRSGFLNKSSQGRQLRYSLTSKGRHFVERGLEPQEQ